MSKQLTIEPSGQQIEVRDGETLLDAALRSGFNMPYGCKNGACGACKGKLLSGEVQHDSHSDSALSKFEAEHGWALFCCAHPETDVAIECREIAATKDIQIKTLPCRVQKIDKVSHDVAVLSLKLPTTERLQFLAGQYIDIHTKTGKKRSFSIANPPHAAEYLELHIRNVPGGEFSNYVWNEMQEKEIYRFTGPLGSFFLREESDKPIIFLATGTGFAPIKGILEHAFNKGIKREIILYWGARTLADLYMPQLPGQWQQQYVNFTFIPVLSEPAPEDVWQGRTGFLHEVVLEDFGSLAHHQVYACGAPVMVEAAYKHFVARGLPEEEFFSDAFFTARDLAKP
ncbi:CDP-6-deoxy-delta-3,4-glucoseen reductase [Chitinilyticum piscinae]|uniref:CDP-6-deoxy-delta-3,4-glucoseen reductase n=1 Tax=Chitinilyticum piscinae TaxID=2866724 RepID=A0A8J7G295_9NEIS|nr:CDP-6-deoxy-delta-3,4-glucoseen reductase [Chitinilyticum piscinae]MBE9610073.1 CDP-6-deoxy-delta-3,4-glucoseen reductase [Chitinilyticum piscinae]